MVSIVTPCKNAEKTIRRTIESVIKQDLCDYEYIIIDGLSSDGTMGIITEYATKYPQIVVISEKDNSMTEALNKGFRMCKGEVVCSINADDEYCDGALSLIEKEFQQNDYDILIGSTRFVKDGKTLYKSYPSFMMNRFLLNILDCSAPESSVFFKRKALLEIGLFNETYKYTQDYELYIRMAKRNYRFGFINKIVSLFYFSDDQYSTRLYDKMLNEACMYNEFPFIFRFLKKTRINNAIKRMLGWTR